MVLHINFGILLFTCLNAAQVLTNIPCLLRDIVEFFTLLTA